ncbi:hypothetical protein CBER1_04104 [Cercospora berteroae]|uniref:Uncharacterized protein n=1 Tax=Cercospora berteroae TaxID=357750 RepID=A0A2S6CGS5_9PEZI|nr:hypothetical protein CBER1_04104 [Cercospora berteroae]
MESHIPLETAADDISVIKMGIFGSTVVESGSWTWEHVAAALNISEATVAEKVMEAVDINSRPRSLVKVLTDIHQLGLSQKTFQVKPRIGTDSTEGSERTLEEIVTLQLWQDAPQDHPLHNRCEKESCDQFLLNVLDEARSASWPKPDRLATWEYVAIWMIGDPLPYNTCNIEELLPDGKASIDSIDTTAFSLSKLILKFEMAFKDKYGWNAKEWGIFDNWKRNWRIQNDLEFQSAIQNQVYLLREQSPHQPLYFHTKKVQELVPVDVPVIRWQIGAEEGNASRTLGGNET